MPYTSVLILYFRRLGTHTREIEKERERKGASRRPSFDFQGEGDYSITLETDTTKSLIWTIFFLLSPLLLLTVITQVDAKGEKKPFPLVARRYRSTLLLCELFFFHFRTPVSGNIWALHPFTREKHSALSLRRLIYFWSIRAEKKSISRSRFPRTEKNRCPNKHTRGSGRSLFFHTAVICLIGGFNFIFFFFCWEMKCFGTDTIRGYISLKIGKKMGCPLWVEVLVSSIS